MSDQRSIGVLNVDGNGLEILNRAECLRLLAGATLGRVAITLGTLPAVFPVNFRLVGDRIAFRTGQGTKLEAATRHAVVAFQVDRIEPFSHAGWSVMVTGVAQEVRARAEIDSMDKANIPRWAPFVDERIISISMDLVSGRRIVPGLHERTRTTETPAIGAVVVRDLNDATCRTLLSSRDVGRLAFVVEGYPVVVPVNYSYTEGRICIRTGAGEKLDNAPLSAVSFEVDDIQPSTRTGWSVLARGIGHWATAEDIVALPLVEPWIPGPLPAKLVVKVNHLSGRRIERAECRVNN